MDKYKIVGKLRQLFFGSMAVVMSAGGVVATNMANAFAADQSLDNNVGVAARKLQYDDTESYVSKNVNKKVVTSEADKSTKEIKNDLTETGYSIRLKQLIAEQSKIPKDCTIDTLWAKYKDAFIAQYSTIVKLYNTSDDADYYVANLSSAKINGMGSIYDAAFVKGTNNANPNVIKDIKFDKEILLKIIKIGLPTGFQQSIVSLSNVIVQSYINVYGASVIAGYSVTIKIDGFVNLPLQAFNMAITTFVGQNIGAKQYDRVKKGAYITTALATLTIACFVVIMYFFGRDFIALFNQEKDVIDAGRLMQLTFLPFYIVLPINQVINGVLRGAGRSAVPMYVMIFSFVFLRQIYLFLITKVTSDIVYVFLGWPTTWVVCSLIFIIYFFKVQWLPQEKDA